MNLTISVVDQAIYGVLILLGLAVCFLGYRLFRFWLVLAGLQAGFFLGLWLGNAVLRSPVLILVVAILCALIVAGISFALVRLGALLAGAAVMTLLVNMFMQLFGIKSNPYVLLVAMVIGGLLGVLSVKPFLILATAVNGAYLVADSIASLISGHALGDYLQTHSQMKTGALILLLVGMIVLSILGAMVQFSNSHKNQSKELASQHKQSAKNSVPPPQIHSENQDSGQEKPPQEH